MQPSVDDFQKVYDQISVAFEERDLASLMNFIHRDWKGEAEGETHSRKDLEEHVSQQFQEFRDISWPRTVSEVRGDGNHFTVRNSGPYRATKADSEEVVEMVLTNEDTWVHTADGWQNVHSVAIS